MAIILGVDPGLTGALAFFDTDAPNRIDVLDMPTVNKEIDGGQLAQYIRDRNPVMAVVEQVAARPGQGVSSMFRFGLVYGAVLGVLGACMVPRTDVAPNVWKRKMRFAGGDEGKEQARAWAIRTFPLDADRFRRKSDHGRADAAALAVWLGGTLNVAPVVDWDSP